MAEHAFSCSELDLNDSSSSEPTSTPRTSRKRQLSEPTTSNTKKIKNWPTRATATNVIFCSKEGKWKTVDYVVINKKKHKFCVVQDCTYNLIMSDNIFQISEGGCYRAVPCTQNGEEVYAKAKHLYNQVKYFKKMTRGFTRCTPYRSPCTDNNESEDTEIKPAFDAEQTAVVNFLFKELHEMYDIAIKAGLFNCIGKRFLRLVGEYIRLCFIGSPKEEVIKSLLNTSKGSLQPGACLIKWSVLKRIIKSNTEQDQRCIVTNERYADNVVYDAEKDINIIVSEVKESFNDATKAQNNEQMLGLWKKNQQAMLGLQFNGLIVIPKVLLLQSDGFHLYYLPELNVSNNDAFCDLLYLMLAFLSIVNYSFEDSDSEAENLDNVAAEM